MQQDQTSRQLGTVRRHLLDRQLLKALTLLRPLVEQRTEWALDSSLESLETNYKTMLSYVRQGVDDPLREKVYDDLLRKAYALVCRAEWMTRLRRHPHYQTEHPDYARAEIDLGEVETRLQDYVASMAMLALEAEGDNRTAQRNHYLKSHADYMQDVFGLLAISPLWNEGMAQQMQDLLLTPTVDSADQQLMATAVMLSGMQTFDILKQTTLMEVYTRTADVRLRQRALVGWVMMIDDGYSRLFPEQRQRLDNLLADGQTRRDLTELQLQLIYCLETKNDTDKIQKEIMPDLVKNQRMRNVALDMDDESEHMDDILGTGETDKALEKLEDSMRKMMEMQRNGSDIYFGGFKMMKRFPFFNVLSNWFVPFSADHPQLLEGMGQNLEHRDVMLKMINVLPFCDSDKYSFALAMRQVFAQLPKHIADMIGKGELVPADVHFEGIPQTVIARRAYLQDLYRFFNLSPMRGAFADVFDQRHYLFFANPIFRRTALESHFNEVCAFLYKKNRTDDFAAVIANHDEHWEDADTLLMRANWLMRQGDDAEQAYQLLRQVLTQRPDDRKVLAATARAAYRTERYEEAAATYKLLVSGDDSQRRYELSYLVSLAMKGELAEAQRGLFKMYYEHPEDVQVLRALAWCQLRQAGAEAAAATYSKLRQLQGMTPSDCLYAALAAWKLGQTEQVAAWLGDYRRQTGNTDLTSDIRKNLAAEQPLLQALGITDFDLQLMEDMSAEWK